MDHFGIGSKTSKGSTVAKWLNQPGLIDPLDFEMFAEDALEKTKVPPRY